MHDLFCPHGGAASCPLEYSNHGVLVQVVLGAMKFPEFSMCILNVASCECERKFDCMICISKTQSQTLRIYPGRSPHAHILMQPVNCDRIYPILADLNHMPLLGGIHPVQAPLLFFLSPYTHGEPHANTNMLTSSARSNNTRRSWGFKAILHLQ